jgi:hypothetical protein
MLREHTDSQTSLADFDHGVLNRVDVNAFVHHYAGDEPKNYLVTDDDSHDCTGNSHDLVSFSLETTTHVVVVLSDLFESVGAFLVAEDVELGEGGGCLDRVDAGRVVIGVGHLSYQLDQFLVLAADEANIRAETLAASSTENDVREVSETLKLPGA